MLMFMSVCISHICRHFIKRRCLESNTTVLFIHRHLKLLICYEIDPEGQGCKSSIKLLDRFSGTIEAYCRGAIYNYIG